MTAFFFAESQPDNSGIGSVEKAHIATVVLAAILPYTEAVPRPYFLQEVWQLLLNVYDEAPGNIPPPLVLTILCFFFDAYFPVAAGCLDIRKEDCFWRIIQAGLTLWNTFSAKKAVHLLRRVLEVQEQCNEGGEYCTYFVWDQHHSQALMLQWRTFCLLYDILDEHGLHLVKPVFGEILQLHASLNADKPALDFSWIALLYRKAFNHSNFGVFRLSIQTVLTLDFSVYDVAALPVTFVGSDLFEALSNPMLFRNTLNMTTDPGAIRSKEVCQATKGRGGIMVAEEDFQDYNCKAMRACTVFFQAYTAALTQRWPVSEAACWSVEGHSRKQQLVKALIGQFSNKMLPVSFGALFCNWLTLLDHPSDEPPLLTHEGVLALIEVLKLKIQDAWPLSVELRVMAGAVLGLLNLIGNPQTWLSQTADANSLSLEDVATCLNSLTRGGLAGPYTERVGYSSGIGSPFSVWLLPRMQRVVAYWLGEAIECLAPLALPGVASFLSSKYTFLEAAAAHLAAQVAVAWLPYLTPQSRMSALHPLWDGLAGLHSRTHMPTDLKYRLLVLLQEVVAVSFPPSPPTTEPVQPLCDPIPFLNFVHTFIPEIIAYTLTQFTFGSLSQSQGMTQHTALVDALCGTFYALLRISLSHTVGIALKEGLKEILSRSVAFLDAFNATKVANLDVFQALCANVDIRNAGRAIHTACLLHTEGCLTLGTFWGPEENSALLHTLRRVRMITMKTRDVPVHLTEVSPGQTTSQCLRYLWQSVVVLVAAAEQTNTLTKEDCQFAFEFGMEMLDEADVQNTYVACHLVLVTLPRVLSLQDADETYERVVTALVAAAKQVTRQSSVQCWAAVMAVLGDASILKHLSDQGRVSWLHHFNGIVGELTEMTARVAYTLALPICGSLLRYQHTDSADLVSAITEAAFHALTLDCGAQCFDEELNANASHWVEAGKTALEVDVVFPSMDEHAPISRMLVISCIRSIAQTHWESSQTTHPLIVALWLRIVDPSSVSDSNAHDIATVMLNNGCFKAHMRKYQFLAATVDYIDFATASAVIPHVIILLTGRISGTLRRYLELVSIHLTTRFPELQELWVPVLTQWERSPAALSSFLEVLGQIVISSQDKPASWKRFSPSMVPFLTSHHHRTRAYAQAMFCKIMENSELFDISPGDNGILHSIYDFATTHPDLKKWKERTEDYVFYDVERNLSLHDLYCQRRREGDSWVDDYTPFEVFKRIGFPARELSAVCGCYSGIDFWRIKDMVKRCAPDGIPEICDARSGSTELPAVPALRPPENAWIDAVDEVHLRHQATWQRKITPFSKVELLQDEVNPRHLVGQQARQPLIIVASFVSNAINVAALCRCAEVFQASCLIVNDMSVIQEQGFKGTCVQAHLWCPMEAVPAPAVRSWLKERRNLGWRLIGIEQTADSTTLPHFAFGDRPTVLVLGAEKAGIPIGVIQILDACVEIPQLGVIRSLNVHACGAILMYEYTRQRLIKR